jgi:hypothetical protein
MHYSWRFGVLRPPKTRWALPLEARRSQRAGRNAANESSYLMLAALTKAENGHESVQLFLEIRVLGRLALNL